MVKNVALTGKYRHLSASVSDEDYELVALHGWHRCPVKGLVYARALIGGTPTFMHVFILGKRDGLEIDHRDGDGLNNTRENIWHATHLENMQNTKFHRERAEWRRQNPIDWTEAVSKF